MTRLENFVFRKMAPKAIRYISQPTFDRDDPLVRDIIDQVDREFQLAPPLTIHALDSRLLAGVWSITREAYVVGLAGRSLRELVAATVSQLNECPYCVDVHTAMSAAGSPTSDTDKAAARRWAAATLEPNSEAILHPFHDPDSVPQLFATAVAYHYINRMVNIFLDASPVPIPGIPRAFGRAALGFFSKRLVALDPKPGEHVWQAEATTPEEFAWSGASPAVTKGLAQMSLAAEQAGEDALPLSVRTLITDHLATWHGEQPPLSRSWVDDLVMKVDESLRPAAIFALLAARASWQVDKKVVADFRNAGAEDRILVQAAAWASWTSARRIASWLRMPSL